MTAAPSSTTPIDVLVLYGTRPEAIKMAPVIRELQGRPERFHLTVCVTAQHREMLDQVHEAFGIVPDLDLDLMRPSQSLNQLAARVFEALDEVLEELVPDWVLVQGDTTTAAIATFAAFHRRLAVGHVEAGLRTGDLSRPFPEEANRRIVDLLAAAHFAPTARARDALLAEGADPPTIHLTGNTIVDALRCITRGHAGKSDPEVLVTVHRRESFGAPLARILTAVNILARSFPDLRWVFPVHPNPNVREPAYRALADLANVELHEPFTYPELVRRLECCRLVLTDSGGIQEEAPTFGKPVLVLRSKTERPEGIEAGVARLVGDDVDRIVADASRLLTDRDAYDAMAHVANPYGDGAAARRIVAVLAGEDYVPFHARSGSDGA